MAINGFDEETNPLTEEELEQAKILTKVLSNRVGENSAITSKEIITGFKDKLSQKINEARIRKLINHIRINHWVVNLVASSKGYYIETDKRKVLIYVASLQQRSDAILAVAKSFQL